MVGCGALKTGGTLVLNLMLNIIIDVNASALRALTQILQTLRLEDMPGDFFTAVSYLKGALLLILHFLGLPIYTMWLVNNTMGSADCDELSGCMNSVYFEHKRKTRTISHQECLRLAERKYRILYRTGKWTAFKNDPLSGFFVASDKDSRNHIRYEGG